MSVFVGRSAMHIANTDYLTTNINGVQQLGSNNDKKNTKLLGVLIIENLIWKMFFNHINTKISRIMCLALKM